MTIGEVISRLKKYWIVIALCTLIPTLFLFQWSTQKLYQGSVTVGMQLNNEMFLQAPNSITALNGTLYSDMLTSFTTYLSARYTTPQIQSRIADQAGLTQKDYSETKPFYTVTPQSAGFVTISTTTADREQAEKFNTAAKDSYNDIVKEWNEARLTTYQVRPMNAISSSVIELQRPVHLLLLPAVVGFLVGVSLALIIPSLSRLRNKMPHHAEYQSTL